MNWTERQEDLIAELNDLKTRRNGIVIAHNYQLAQVQEVADMVGDSLELSRRAAETDAEVIVFCGVDFMAETASLLAPQKKVLLPEPEAGCPMAEMITGTDLVAARRKDSNLFVVCYVNSTAATKAESDICCTSSNAELIVSQIPDDRRILFVPDRYLGGYVAERTGRRIDLWPGFCATHARIMPSDIESRLENDPGANGAKGTKVVVHPECRPEVRQLADAVLSTGGICRFAAETDTDTIIVGTEIGMLHRLRKENPGKNILPATEQAICPNMKLIGLEDVVRSLRDMVHEVTVPLELRKRAAEPVRRMLEACNL